MIGPPEIRPGEKPGATAKVCDANWAPVKQAEIVPPRARAERLLDAAQMRMSWITFSAPTMAAGEVASLRYDGDPETCSDCDAALPNPEQTPLGDPIPAGRRAFAIAVHIFTASGVVWAFLSLVAVVQGDLRAMFFWLAVALFVDGIDGSIARRIDITRAAPRWSGAVLDQVVDYLTYVFVPAYALAASPLLGDGWDIAAAVIILMSSAMYFADNEMKTEDAWFKGFPAVWNLVVFYLFLLSPQPVVTFLSVAVLGILTFAPIVFVHPFRVAKLRPVTLTLLVIWSVLALYSVWMNLAPGSIVVWILSAIALYFLVLGYFRTKPDGSRRA